MYDAISTDRDTMHEAYICGAELENGFPVLPPIHAKPKESVSFREIQKIIDTKDKVVHFYIDDFWFEKLWTNADRYIPQLKCFPYVIMPDFSVFSYMPEPMQHWNRYRSMALGYYLSSKGVHIIPSLGVLTKDDTWTLCGVPRRSTVAVCTNGRIKKPLERKTFVEGLQTQIQILQPTNLIMVGYIPKEYDESVPTIYLKSEAQKRRIK